MNRVADAPLTEESTRALFTKSPMALPTCCRANGEPFYDESVYFQGSKPRRNGH